MRIVRWLLAALLLVAALVQFNDPDPWGWVLLYGLASVLLARAALGRPARGISLGLAVVAIGGALWLAPSVLGEVTLGALFTTDEMTGDAVERGREMAGLLLVAAALLVAAGGWPRRSGA